MDYCLLKETEIHVSLMTGKRMNWYHRDELTAQVTAGGKECSAPWDADGLLWGWEIHHLATVLAGTD